MIKGKERKESINMYCNVMYPTPGRYDEGEDEDSLVGSMLSWASFTMGPVFKQGTGTYLYKIGPRKKTVKF